MAGRNKLPITPVRLPNDVRVQLDELAAKTGKTKNQLLNEAVIQYLRG